MLGACSAPKQGHTIYTYNVNNFARHIETTLDFVVFKEWLNNLHKEPVYSINGTITWETVKKVQASYRSFGYERTFNHWDTKAEFVKKKKGDCKSFAIAKYKDLRALGATKDQVNLWSGDFGKRSHMVVVIDINGEQKVLDIYGDPIPAKDYFYKKFIPAYRLNEDGWDTN